MLSQTSDQTVVKDNTKKKKKSCQIQIKILSSHVSLSISILHYLFFLVILSHHEREKLAAALKT